MTLVEIRRQTENGHKFIQGLQYDKRLDKLARNLPTFISDSLSNEADSTFSIKMI